MVSSFLSYSAADSAFARQLYDVLTASNHATWVDWEDRPATPEWLAEVDAAIEAADIFIVVLSPESVASTTCQHELSHALAVDKRIVAVLVRAIDAASVSGLPPRAQWIDFQESATFPSATQRLLATLDADEAYTKLATRLLLRARDWERQGRDPEYLLAGDDLLAAESWLAAGQARQPAPHGPQVAFIAASRTRAGPARAVRPQAAPRSRARPLGVIVALIGIVLLCAIGALAVFNTSLIGLERPFPTATPEVTATTGLPDTPTPGPPGTPTPFGTPPAPTATPVPFTTPVPTTTPAPITGPSGPALLLQYASEAGALFWLFIASLALNIAYTVAFARTWVVRSRQVRRKVSADDPIFISYSRSDSDFVDQLNTDLQQRKFKIWMDRTRLRGGQVWSSEIRHSLDTCRAMVLVLSPDAVSSHAVHNELHYALRHHKKVIPVFYHPCPSVPNEVKRLQHLDFVAGMNFDAKYRVSLSKLVDALADTAAATSTSAAGAAVAA